MMVDQVLGARTPSKMSSEVLDQSIIAILGARRFAIQDNLIAYLQVPRQRISDQLNRLIAQGWVDAAKEMRPYAYRLTNKACLAYGYPLSRWPKNLAALQRTCLRNHIECLLREEYDQVRLLSAEYLKTLLIYNAISEYVFEVIEPGKTQKIRMLVVLDDYGMPPSRLKKIWTRRHCVSQGGNLTYGQFVHDWRLYVCNEYLMQRHFEYAKRHQLKMDLEVIEPIWGIS